MQLPRGQQAVWRTVASSAQRDAGRVPAPHEVARALGLHATTVRQHLGALERKGLLAIEPAGVGRPPRLALTPSGRVLAGVAGLPVLGSIPAGPLADALQDPVGYLSLAGTVRPGWFGLRVSGDSMADLIVDGDVVVLQSGVEPRPNEICALRVDDERATLKYLRASGPLARLVPHNPAYPTLEVELERVRVDGAFRGLVRGELASLALEAPM